MTAAQQRAWLTVNRVDLAEVHSQEWLCHL
jgi:hypothetical protein